MSFDYQIQVKCELCDNYFYGPFNTEHDLSEICDTCIGNNDLIKSSKRIERLSKIIEKNTGLINSLTNKLNKKKERLNKLTRIVEKNEERLNEMNEEIIEIYALVHRV